MKSPAIVFHQPDTPRLEDVSIPPLAPDEVRVRTRCSGVSIGTERSIFSGDRIDNGTFPFVGGYMASGVIEAVGDACERWRVGQRVVTHTSRLDGPVQAIWGGHAGVQTTHESLVAAMPDGLSFEEASMFVLPCVSFNAVRVAQITEHDTVLIQGPGLIGQMFGQAARNRGARVAMIEPNAERAALARRYVTDDVLGPHDADVDTVKSLWDGQGPSVVVEATGVAKLIDNASRHLVTGGRFVFLAWYPGSIAFHYHAFHSKGATALFPTGSGGPPVFRAVLEALGRGALVVGDNVTHRVAARDAVAAYESLIAGDASVMGMVIDWSER